MARLGGSCIMIAQRDSHPMPIVPRAKFFAITHDIVTNEFRGAG